MARLRIEGFEIILGNAGELSVRDDDKDSLTWMNELVMLYPSETQQLLDFLQTNLTTTSNEDTIASKIAKDSANEFVREYKQECDNNWNIS